MIRTGTRVLVRSWFVLSVLAAVTAAARAEAASVAERCVSSQAEERALKCPASQSRNKARAPRRFSFRGTALSKNAKRRGQAHKPRQPKSLGKSFRRDERRRTARPRIKRLLTTEIRNLERLLGATPRRHPDRPHILRRLAEGYVELEALSFRTKVEAEVKALALKRKKRKQAAKWLALAKKSSKSLELARQRAIRYYRRLKQQYPKWCQFPSRSKAHRGCMDEVLYYLAYEYEQAGKLDQARDAYLELVERWKDSRFVPHAYLAFGELFFEQAQRDPSKWSLAAQAYQKVLQHPPPENRLYGYAHYKLAYVHWNQGEFDKAIDEFQQVIRFGQQFRQLPSARGLAKSARYDLIPVYALAGDPAKAHGFFRPLSGDQGASSKRTFRMMEALGRALLDTGQYPQAMVLYEDLIQRNPGPRWCRYRSHITTAVLADESGNKAHILAALRQQLGDYHRFRQEPHPPESRLECANHTAAFITETAMAWHLEAVGSGGVRGTGDPNTLASAEALYQLALRDFTAADFARFRFPRLVKEDWPTLPKIQYALADLLYVQKKWDRCGPAFDAVVAADPRGADADEAIIASVICYENAFIERHKDGAHRRTAGHLSTDEAGGAQPARAAAAFAPQALAPEQQQMVSAMRRYLCSVAPPARSSAERERYAEIKFALARTWFDTHHWEEAAAGFREVALDFADTDAGSHAAQLYLEAINVLGSRIKEPRLSCYGTMAQDLPKLVERYCTAARADEQPEHCAVLARVRRDVAAKQAEAWVAKADQKRAAGQAAVADYERAAEAYMAVWNQFGRQACEQQEPGCERMAAVLYNAARAFQAAYLVAKAIAVRRVLVDPRFHLHTTEPARQAVYEIGASYQAIAVYDRAAHWYEQFAQQSPGAQRAPVALSDAVVLRLGLGQPDQAEADASRFRRAYGVRRPAEAARIAFAIGAHAIERADWRGAERQLSRAMRQIEAEGTVDVRIRAWALLARAYARLGRQGQADRLYAKVRDAWSDPAARRAELAALDGTDAQKRRRLTHVLDAVGEALYHFADQERAAADRLELPAYGGSGERTDVERHIQTRVKAWIEQKGPAIARAERAFARILEIEPTPPPRWVIAAGAAVGHLWGRFVAEFRAAPYPREWDQPGFSPYGQPPLRWHEIRAHYWEQLRLASERYQRKAKAAYQTCLGYSVRYQYFDERSRSCETWLSKNYAAEYHLMDEFRGMPVQVGSGLDERSEPVSSTSRPLGR